MRTILFLAAVACSAGSVGARQPQAVFLVPGDPNGIKGLDTTLTLHPELPGATAKAAAAAALLKQQARQVQTENEKLQPQIDRQKKAAARQMTACARLCGEDPDEIERVAAGFRRIAFVPTNAEGVK